MIDDYPQYRANGLGPNGERDKSPIFDNESSVEHWIEEDGLKNWDYRIERVLPP